MNLTSREVREIKKSYILQSDSSDCGVACLGSILNYYNKEYNLEVLRNLSGTSSQGTSLLGIQQASKKTGLDSNGFKGTIDELKKIKKITILHCLIDETLEHFILVYGYSKSKGFLILDPSKGVNFVDDIFLENIWKSKVCLVFEDSKKIIRKNNNDKLKWVKDNIYPERHFLIFAIFLGILTSILSIAMSIFSQKLIDEILPAKNFDKLFWSVILLFVILNLRSFFYLFQQYLLSIESFTLNSRLNQKFFKNLLSLPLSFFESKKIGDVITRVNDSEKIISFIKKLISNFLIEIFTIITSIGTIFYYSNEIGYLTLIFGPILFVCIYLFNKSIIRKQKDVIVNNSNRESNYIDTIKNVNEILINNKQKYFFNNNKKFNEKFLKSSFDLDILNIKIQSFVSILSTSFIIVIILLSCYYILEQKLELGTLVALIGISSTLLISITNIALILIPINETKIILNRVLEFNSIENEKLTELKREKIYHINIKDIFFNYPGSKYLLNNISLEIEKGNIIGLLGNSGSGKTTLSKILLGFYKKNKGSIIINNEIEIEDINIFSYRESISYLSQNIDVFNDTLLKNIVLDDYLEEEKLTRVLSFPFINIFIDRLQQGINTIIGENGVNLSGGQKQILGLMRILYKAPDFIIFDEPTSSLDKEAEIEFCKMIEKIKKEHLILFISHDVSLLKKITNDIYVLENKTVSRLNNE